MNLENFAPNAVVEFINQFDSNPESVNQYLSSKLFESEKENKLREMLRTNYNIHDVIQFLIILFKEIDFPVETQRNVYLQLFKLMNEFQFSEGIRKVSIKVDTNPNANFTGLSILTSVFDSANDRNPWSTAPLYHQEDFDINQNKQALINALISFIFRKQRLMWIVPVDKHSHREKEDFTETYLVEALKEMIDQPSFFIEISIRTIHIQTRSNELRWSYGVKRLQYK